MGKDDIFDSGIEEEVKRSWVPITASRSDCPLYRGTSFQTEYLLENSDMEVM